MNYEAKSTANLNDFLENLFNKKNTSNNEKKTTLNFITENCVPYEKEGDCSCFKKGVKVYHSCCFNKVLLEHFKTQYYYPKDYYLIDTNSKETKQKLPKISKDNELNNFITKYKKRFAEILKKHTEFGAFCKSHTQNKTNICDVTEAKWTVSGPHVTFNITANRFLRNMVRAIVGTLIEVGENKIDLNEFEKIIESQNRQRAGYSVPANGLFLENVLYNRTDWKLIDKK